MHDDLIIELVRHYSPSYQEQGAVGFLVDWMTAHGFEAWIDEAGNACGMRGKSDAPNTLIMLGHIDTVQGEIPVRVEDGILYGRGSVDAKGSLATFEAATSAANIPENWRVIVIGAVEEEVASSKGAHFVRDLYQPNLCVIGEPSGADRITLGYKGRLLVDFCYERPFAHSAGPEPSAGAVGAAFWQQVADWCAEQNQGRERLFEQVIPHLHDINTRNDGFTESVQMRVGFRLPPQIAPDEVADKMRELVPESAVLQSYGAVDAYQGDKNNALVRGMLAAIRAQGAKPGFVLKTGTSDMNVVGTVWNCPMIAYGPGDSSLDHTPNEHLSLAEYGQAVETLKYLIEHLPDTI